MLLSLSICRQVPYDTRDVGPHLQVLVRELEELRATSQATEKENALILDSSKRCGFDCGTLSVGTGCVFELLCYSIQLKDCIVVLGTALRAAALRC